MNENTSNVTITGVFYLGDVQNKYSKRNEMTYNKFFNVLPFDLAVFGRMPNYKEGADKVMFKQVDMDETLRNVYPSPPQSEELLHFEIEPERHDAYSQLWNIFTFLNIVANSVLWLYF